MRRLLPLLFLLVALRALPQSIAIVPGSTFPINNTPSDGLRVLGVDTNGTQSGNPLTKSNFTSTVGGLKLLFGGYANSTLGSSVTVLRGTNVLSFPSLTNAFANGFISGDTVNIPAGTNYIDSTVTPLMQLPQGITIKGQGREISWILFNTNVFLITNNNTFQDFSCISTQVYAASDVIWAFKTPSTTSWATNCIWRNVNIKTYGNGIEAFSASTGTFGWIVDNCGISVGQRGVYLSGATYANINIRNSRITTTENTNMPPVTLVGLSLSDTGSNVVDNCTIVTDANGSTNAVEYIGFYSGSGTNYITKTFFSMLNTNNLPLLGASAPNVLLETSGFVATDGSIPSSQFGFNYLSSHSLQKQLGGDWTKLGVDELQLVGTGSTTVVSNAFYDIPNGGSALLFDNLPSSIIKWTQHFSGLPALSSDFSALNLGYTNNVILTNVNGLSVVFAATNGLWVTNIAGAGPKFLCTSNGTDLMMITNIGSVPFTAYRGSLQELTNTANIGLDGLLVNPTTFAFTVTNPLSIAWGDWNGLYTNISYITVKPFIPVGTRVVGMSNWWCANAIPGSRQKTFTINSTGSGGSGAVLPPNAKGLLSNDGLGNTNWYSFTNIIVLTNNPTFSIGQMLVITGTNANGSLTVKGTNIPPAGGGGGAVLPPNAAGLLSNDGTGLTNWYAFTNLVTWTNQPTSFQVGQFLVICGTNANGALVVTNVALPSQTNFVGLTNQNLAAAGQWLFLTGTNAQGVWQASPTNPPSGGSIPNGLVTNNGLGTVIVPSPLVITNAIESDSIRGSAQFDTLINGATPVILNLVARSGSTATSSGVGANWLHIINPRGGINMDTDSQFVSSNSISKTGTFMDTNNAWHFFSNSVETVTISPVTGTVQGSNIVANGMGTNFFGGLTTIASNAAVRTRISSSGLHTVATGKGWTNDLGADADMFIEVFYTPTISQPASVSFTNTITGESFTNSVNVSVADVNKFLLVVPGISPGDKGSLTDVSGAGASVSTGQSWWKLH